MEESGRERVIGMTKEDSYNFRYPSLEEVIDCEKANCSDDVNLWQLLDELKNIDPYIVFRFMLHGFSVWFQKDDPLTVTPGRKFSVYIVNPASGKIEPIAVSGMEKLNNVPWFKSKDDVYYAISQLHDIYIKVYPNGSPK